jgi:serine/threonine protein phosphatase 1
MKPDRLIAIGDVHGCVHALDAILDAIAPTPADQLVFLGDLVDQGPDSRDVLMRIIELKNRCDVVLIQGNHEEMMLAARESEGALRFWENCGGIRTINSYKFGGSLDDVPGEHWALIEECRPYYETDDTIFTHANYLPDVPMPSQPGHQLRWVLFDPAELQPHVSGKPIVVGHTEQSSAEILDVGFTTCIDTTCWKYGWLTALECPTQQVWQASRWGVLRDSAETSHREQLSKILRPVRA